MPDYDSAINASYIIARKDMSSSVNNIYGVLESQGQGAGINAYNDEATKVLMQKIITVQKLSSSTAESIEPYDIKVTGPKLLAINLNTGTPPSLVIEQNGITDNLLTNKTYTPQDDFSHIDLFENFDDMKVEIDSIIEAVSNGALSPQY